MTDKATGLERESLVIRGVRSELRLEGGVITIVKEATTQATPTSVTIQVRNVRGSTVEAPKRGGRGWLHIATVNGSPAPVGELSASGDPFALPITGRQLGASRKLSRMIDRHVKDRGMPADVGPNQGRFTSGVVMSGVVKPRVSEPAVPEPAAEQESMQQPAVKRAVRKNPTRPQVSVSDSARPSNEDSPPPKKAATKRAAAKKAATKKAATKKAATSRKSPAKPPATKASKPSGNAELVAQLRELGELHAAGVLDAAEFAAAKAKLLA